MSPRTDTAPTAPAVPSAARPGARPDEQVPAADLFELDVTIVEAGPEADQLIRMTDDGCGQTCESACGSTCP